MSEREDLFVGWRDEMPRVDRRIMIAAGVGLVSSAIALGAAAGARQTEPGDGDWDAGDVRTWTGQAMGAPYPALRWVEEGQTRTAFLTTQGKTAVRFPERFDGQSVRIRASLIARGRNAMLAVADRDWIEADGAPASPALREQRIVDHGEVLLAGEILDAKCWFGAMRPGYGKTHRACAALCARGGLPLAFCRTGMCGQDEDAPLFVDRRGRAHGRSLVRFAGDPVAVVGRLVQIGDVTQLRVDEDRIHRI